MHAADTPGRYQRARRVHVDRCWGAGRDGICFEDRACTVRVPEAPIRRLDVALRCRTGGMQRPALWKTAPESSAEPETIATASGFGRLTCRNVPILLARSRLMTALMTWNGQNKRIFPVGITLAEGNRLLRSLGYKDLFVKDLAALWQLGQGRCKIHCAYLGHTFQGLCQAWAAAAKMGSSDVLAGYDSPHTPAVSVRSEHSRLTLTEHPCNHIRPHLLEGRNHRLGPLPTYPERLLVA
ncbi:hypothetical protein C8Q78DRAFT_667879 [Trametes maxima]|nr:hypothetical protein C8Q78DRAFT_667879 [Trametes maxima]